ncbi:MAG: hypothetical protein AAFX87_29355, partial [Bacteroidota bacterium]
MKRQVYWLLSVTLIMVTSGLKAQQTIMDVIDPNYQNQKLLETQAYDDILGSPYFDDDWHTGTIVTNNDQKFEDVQIKYDAYADELLVKQKSGKEIVVSKSMVKSFFYTKSGDSYKYHFKPIKSGKKGGKEFHQVLYEGKLSLLKRFKKEI